jgi:hypothetical protein
MAGNLIFGILVLGIILFASTMVLPMIGITGFELAFTQGGLALLLFVVGLLVLGQAFGMKIPQISQLLKPFSGKFALLMAGGMIVAAMFFGLTIPGLEGIFAGDMPVGTVADAGVAGSTCWAAASPEIRGTSTTLTLDGYDRAANSDTPIGNHQYAVYNSETGMRVDDFADTAESSVSTVIVGNSYDIYGGNGSYYTDPVERFCIKGQQAVVEMDAWQIQAESSMSITVYDDTDTELDAGKDTTNEEDYNLTLGADEEKLIRVKLKNNAANKVYDHCAWALRTANDIDKIEIQESGYSEVPVPKFLKTTININSTGVNLTNYETVVKGPVVRLIEWQSLKHDFVVSAGSTDPSHDDTGSSSSDLAILLSLDCAWEKGQDGKMHYDFYAHTDSEEDATGMTQTVASPLGKQVGVIIEGI